MDGTIDARQIERVLSHLARLRHRRDWAEADTLESLRPDWLGLDTWEVVLEDLEAQHYKERPRVAQLRSVG